jgi:predicted PurR-regulated permease PerM
MTDHGVSGDHCENSQHHDMISSPEDSADGPLAEAETAAAQQSTDEHPLGSPGRRFDRRSPFYLGVAASAGVAVTYAGVQILSSLAAMIILIGVAFFLALGLEPAVSWFEKQRLPRWVATTLVFVVFLALLAAFVAAAIPPLIQQASELIHTAPHYLQQAQDHSSTIGQLNDRFHLQQRITDAINNSGGPVFDELISAGTAVFGAVTDTVVVVVLTIYFLVDFPRIRATLYRLVPHTRRPRAILIGDEIFAKVGAYVLGNVLISVITAAATFVWLMAFDVPYPLLLALFVGLFDLIPIVGSTIAGVVVAAVALTVSVPVCLGTIAFFILFRLGEDYLLVPRIIGRAVKVPALTTVVAVLVGGALLGVIGALVAIPMAAAVQLIAEETLFPRLDRL